MANPSTLRVDSGVIHEIKLFRSEVASVVPSQEVISQPGLIEMALEVSRHVLRQLRILGDPGALQGISGKNSEIYLAGGIPAGPLQDIFLNFKTKHSGQVGRPRGDVEFERALTRAFERMPVSLRAELLATTQRWCENVKFRDQWSSGSDGDSVSVPVNVNDIAPIPIPFAPEAPSGTPEEPSSQPVESPPETKQMPVPLRLELLRRLRALRAAGRESEYDYDFNFQYWARTGELLPFEEPTPLPGAPVEDLSEEQTSVVSPPPLRVLEAGETWTDPDLENDFDEDEL